MVSARLRIRLRRTSELITIWITDVDSIDYFNVKSSPFYAVPFNTCTQLNKASRGCLKRSPSSYLTFNTCIQLNKASRGCLNQSSSSYLTWCFTTLFLPFFKTCHYVLWIQHGHESWSLKKFKILTFTKANGLIMW